MTFDFQTVLGTLFALALAYLFLRHIQRRKRDAAELPQRLFSEIMPLLENAQLQPGEAMGSWQVVGDYRGRTLQLKVITDTLALRKLPSLWLMVTLPEPQAVTATIDMMMRPQGPSTFSNFDFLPHTLPTPSGFPADAVIRSDAAGATVPADAMRGAFGLFNANKGKELLISPKGLRIVLQAAEADKARYGVYREANFGETAIPAGFVRQAMNDLIGLANELKTS